MPDSDGSLAKYVPATVAKSIEVLVSDHDIRVTGDGGSDTAEETEHKGGDESDSGENTIKTLENLTAKTHQIISDMEVVLQRNRERKAFQ